ncbi:MAG TPA: hypothetical protein VN426_03285 [Syntrophomonadaceae bacterium]|nr:hypothetical protein [Syntrophomonadaceae bacterium]
MMRRFPAPLEVHCGPDNQPRDLYLQPAQVRVVEVLDCWCDTGCWWDGESEKFFYRLHCMPDLLCEIFQDQHSGQWFLYKIYD